MGKYALLIGVGEYGEGLQPLPTALNDVAALKEVLKNSDMGGFDEVKTLVNPHQRDMAQEIQQWFLNRQTEDLVTLFFSGHGVKDEYRKLYFAARDTQKPFLSFTAIPASFIHDCIRKCKAKRQLVILDCCFSGAFGEQQAKDDGNVELEEQLGAEGRVVLTSTDSVNYSFESAGSDLSVYTRYLVEGINSGAADEDNDGVISVDELHHYAQRKVKESSPAMSPKIITLRDEGYRIQLARSPKEDPQLKYRKKVEKRATTGKFSIAAQRLLNAQRRELGISDEDAQAIEAEVLKPHREYQYKLEEYRATIENSLQAEETLSNETIRDLIDYRKYLGLKVEDVEEIEQQLLGKVLNIDPSLPPLTTQPPPSPPPKVSRKELYECDPSRLLFLKNVRDPNGGWAYSMNRIRKMGGLIESRVFELFWLSTSRGAKSASKGDLMILNQHAKVTHIVEMLDDDVRENEAGYFRWVRVVWLPEEGDWSQLPHQRDIIGFEPPTIGGGTAYSFASTNFGTFQSAWNSLEKFQQHVFQLLTGGNLAETDEIDEDNLNSERLGTNYYAKLRDLLAAKDWKAADQETADRMCEVMNRQEEGWLRIEDIKQLPCQDLRNIDNLWVKYSQGKFGFSVQKEIWQRCGSPTTYDKGLKKFGVEIGWWAKGFFGMGARWRADSELTWTIEAPRGHLPAWRCRVGTEHLNLFLGSWLGHWAVLFSRIQDCRL